MRALLIAISLVVIGVPSLRAQAPDAGTAAAPEAAAGRREDQPEKPSVTAAGIARFFAGAAASLALHEGGHLTFDYLFGASPGVKKVHFGPIPFFAITHDGNVSPRREFVIASAGFWAQQLGSEIILTSRPQLRAERAPMVKGMLAFDLLASVAYAGTALAHAGPGERDTRSMAVFCGVDEGVVGGLILAPAVLDAVRYYRPHAAWARWASRAVKVGMVVLAARRGRSG